MNVRYISRDLEWTEAMKAEIEDKLIKQIQRQLKSNRFELSVHFELDRRHLQYPPGYEMWAVLQTFDGRHNEIVRRQGARFEGLVDEVSGSLKAQMRSVQIPRRFSLNPFRLSPFERLA